MSRTTLLQVYVTKFKIKNQLHSSHNHIDLIFEFAGSQKSLTKMEGIVIPDFKDKVLVEVKRVIDIQAPDLRDCRHLSISIQTKKFRSLGKEILLCQGQVPLSKFFESPAESQKLRVLLHTPSDNV